MTNSRENAIQPTSQQETGMQCLSITQLVDQCKLIKSAMQQAMQLGEHYGTIPGCGKKPTLLKPGAEKLSLLFRLAPHCDDYGGKIITTDLAGGHKNFEVHCAIVHIPTGAVWAVGVGACSTMETKYRYRKGEQKCPQCGKESIIKGKKDYGGGWICFTKKGGCGAKFKDGDKSIENQDMGRIEHDNPSDYYNTCLKMAKKRAYVDGILSATAASEYFTQDIEDMKANGLLGGSPEAEPTEFTDITHESNGQPSDHQDHQPQQQAQTTQVDQDSQLIRDAKAVIGDGGEAVTRWAISGGKLQQGQTWEQLSEIVLNTIVKSGKGFMTMISRWVDAQNGRKAA